MPAPRIFLSATLTTFALAGACANDETSVTSPATAGTGGVTAAGAGGSGAEPGTGGSGGSPECDDAAACPGFDKACRQRVCVDGACGFQNAPSGALCDEGGDREVCDGEGTCVKNLGVACLVGSECHSDICHDGVCCDVSCTGGCEACDLAGQLGLCTPHPGDTDPEGACSGGAGICDGGSACTHGGHRFSLGFGNAQSQDGLAVAQNQGGAVIAGGSFEGDLDFSGQNPLVNAGGRDAFVVKLSSSGGYLWSRHYGASGSQAVLAVARDDTNAVIFAGEFETSIQIGATARTSAGGADAFVAKLDTNGAHLWDSAFGAAGSQRITALAIDTQGHVIVAGELEGTVSFDGGTTSLTSAGGTDVFVAELDENGTHVFSAAFGGAGDDRAHDVSLDGDAIVITGSFTGSIDFGGGVIAAAGGADGYLAKLDTDGNEVWSFGLGGAGSDVGHGVGVDGQGNVVVTGSFEGTVDFGGGPLSSQGATDVFVARYDPSGAHLASARYGTSAAQQGLDVEADASGAFVVVGNYLGNVDFGDGNLGGASGSPDGFVVKLSPDLVPLWRHRFADSVENVVANVNLSPSGDVVVAGRFGSAVDFGGGSRAHRGASDIFIASYRR